MQKSDVTFKSPRDYAKRIQGNNPKTGEPIYYDPGPHVELVDAKSGKYAFKWRGYDGKEKAVIFQRADAIDAVVSASVSMMTSGHYRYFYEIENLPSSGERLSGFTVQHFASAVAPERIDGIYSGTMSPSARHFYEGSWLDFGIPESFTPVVEPGMKIAFRLVSSAPPGLVGCRISGGEQKTIGVGEDMPTELEAILPGYDDWPKGYTIGPVDSLKTLSPTEHVQYILDQLPQFEKLGWITVAARPWYVQHLKSDNLDTVLKHAEQDLKSEQITTEVYALLQSLRN